MLQIEVKFLGGFLPFLNFWNPKSGFSDGNGEIVNFNTEKIFNGNFDGIFGKIDAVRLQDFKDSIFKVAQE